jgi:hypothetical protein
MKRKARIACASALMAPAILALTLGLAEEQSKKKANPLNCL